MRRYGLALLVLIASCGASPRAPTVATEERVDVTPAPIADVLRLEDVHHHAARSGPHYEIIEIVADGEGGSYVLSLDGENGEIVRIGSDGAPLFRRELTATPSALASVEGGGALVVGSRGGAALSTRVSGQGEILFEHPLPAPVSTERPRERGEWELTPVGSVHPWAVAAIDDGFVVVGGQVVDSGTVVFHARIGASGDVRWSRVSALEWSDMRMGPTKTRPMLVVTADSIYTAGPFGEPGAEPGVMVQRRRLSDGQERARRVLPGFYRDGAWDARGARLAIGASRMLTLLDAELQAVRDQELPSSVIDLAFANGVLWMAVGSPPDASSASLSCLRLEDHGVSTVQSWDDMVMHPYEGALGADAHGAYVAYTVYVGRPTSGDPDHVVVRRCDGEAAFDSSALAQEWSPPSVERQPRLLALDGALRLAFTNGYALVWVELMRR